MGKICEDSLNQRLQFLGNTAELLVLCSKGPDANPSLMPLHFLKGTLQVKLSFKFTGYNVAIFKAFQIFVKQRRIQWFSLATTFLLSPLLSAPAIFLWL